MFDFLLDLVDVGFFANLCLVEKVGLLVAFSVRFDHIFGQGEHCLAFGRNEMRRRGKA